jgi:hypothetical protein
LSSSSVAPWPDGLLTSQQREPSRGDPAEIQAAIDEDPEAASAEYLGEFRTDLAAFISEELIASVVIPGCGDLPYDPTQKYYAFADPSGGSAGGDSYTLAIGHAEKDVMVINAIREAVPPFSPEGVTASQAEVCQMYKVREVTGDHYAAQWPVEAWRKAGITYKQSEAPKSDLYLQALPVFTSGKAEIPDHTRLIRQLRGLERRTARSGKDSVDHTPRRRQRGVRARRAHEGQAPSLGPPPCVERDEGLHEGRAWPRGRSSRNAVPGRRPVPHGVRRRLSRPAVLVMDTTYGMAWPVCVWMRSGWSRATRTSGAEKTTSPPIMRGSGYPTKLTEPQLGCSPRQERREQDALAQERLDDAGGPDSLDFLCFPIEGVPNRWVTDCFAICCSPVAPRGAERT